ncbi:hypothetical protein BSK66_27595 [Paenibacillus odorifer]|uniref:hypothetical protein n=1 Tax=Paenibacillus TaxID=44249 RepID=UPI0003E254D9|nr:MULTISPECIES: hypothetical protein [Paenibacillus]ETT61312.1 hypothetical protein C171_12658 [Paenibacillus sp. FSL H8-237]OMD13723.1 hypothetical protein BJP47_24145 [Paenibacillus odorifer]OME48953.1 hypothetical protein BSK66_27595 [Paenibacillus odorifer]
MEQHILWAIIFLTLLMGISLLILRQIRNNNYVSKIVGSLLKSFPERERPLEFRIDEKKAKQTNREFQVKTMRGDYFIVNMKGRHVIKKAPVIGFTLSEEDSLLIGKVDPTDLSRYELEIKTRK